MAKKPVCPTIFDASIMEFRPVTQADVDVLVQRCAAAVNLRTGLLELLGLPLNAKMQVARIAELGGFYRLRELVAASEAPN